MAKTALKLMRAIIDDVRYFSDTNQTRVVIKITHVAPDADYGVDMNQFRLAKPIFASFRLEGEDALKTYASWFYDNLPAHQEVPTFKGGVIFFTAHDIGEGRSTWDGEPMRVLIGLLPESIAFQVRRKRVALTYAKPTTVEETVEPMVSVEFEKEVGSAIPEPQSEETADPNRIEAGILTDQPEEVLV